MKVIQQGCPRCNGDLLVQWTEDDGERPVCVLCSHIVIAQTVALLRRKVGKNGKLLADTSRTPMLAKELI